MRSLAIIVAICAASVGQADHRLTGRDLEKGAELYAGNCASCHGAQLEGQPDWSTPGPNGILPAPPHNATGHTWHHDTQMLLDYTLLGGKAALEAMGVTNFRSGMPAFAGTLSEDQVLDILAYIRSTWPERAQEIQRQRTHGVD